jgi:hypothetical protein
MPIDPLSAGTAAGAWLWAQYGKELTGKLLDIAKGRWEKFNWKKAAERYRESLRAQHATIPLGICVPYCGLLIVVCHF